MRALTRPRAVLLDLDGTLADSISVMSRAYAAFLETLDRKPSLAEFESLNGPPLHEIVRRLKVTHGLQDSQESLLSLYVRVINDLYADVQPSKGAATLLRKAKEHDCFIGVVTSNSELRTNKWLQTVHFADLIDFIVSGDDVNKGKPHPEPYEKAAKKTSCRLSEIVAIEDSPQGARSAVDAGLRTLALGFGKNPSWPDEVEPIESLTQATELLWP